MPPSNQSLSAHNFSLIHLPARQYRPPFHLQPQLHQPLGDHSIGVVPQGVGHRVRNKFQIKGRTIVPLSLAIVIDAIQLDDQLIDPGRLRLQRVQMHNQHPYLT